MPPRGSPACLVLARGVRSRMGEHATASTPPRETFTSRALRGCTAPSRPHGAACGPGRAACQVTEGGTPSRTGSAHRDEQVPAGVERVHGLHDDVRTRRVAREAAEHAFDRAHESRVASRIVRGHSGGARLHLECTT